MEAILTRCGYRCDLCLAYRPNVEADPSNQQTLANGWRKYFGLNIPPEKVVCDGCMAEDPALIDQDCPVRPCVIARGLENCGRCGQYICDSLAQRIVVLAEVRARANAEIPEEEYQRFIRPYENKRRLDALRAAGGAKK